MSVVVKETQTFKPAPEGVHGAVCIDVVDKGELSSEWQGRKRIRRVVVLRWAIDEVREDGTNYFVEQWYTASLNEKATLRAHLELWRGRKFTGEELEGFDLENVLGKGCQLVLLHATKGDKTYANVRGIMPLSKGTQTMTPPTDYVRIKDRPPEPATNGTAPQRADYDDDDERAASYREPLPF